MNEQWSLLKGRKKFDYEFVEDVLKDLKNWSPFMPILVAKPGGDFFLPPTCHPEIARKLVKNYKARVFIGLVLTIAATIVVFFGVMISGSPVFLKGAGLFSLISATILCDYLISFKSLSVLGERTMFFYWVATSAPIRRAVAGWLIFVIFLAILQFLLELWLGGRFELIYHFGAMHEMVARGEIWRLLIGPFFHSSNSHFLINSVFLMIIGPLAWSIYAYRSIFILVAGSAIGALCSTVLGRMVADYPYDSYAGISPGIFALFGSVFMSGIIRKNLLPSGIALHIGFVATISIAAAGVYMQHAADASHCSGLVFGMILSLWLNVRSINIFWKKPI